MEKNKDGKLIGVNYNYEIQEPRQLRDMEYVENGAIYMFKPKIILDNSNRFGGDIGMIPNKFWQSFEIDEKDDWEFVELIFKNYLLDEYNKRMMDSKEYEKNRVVYQNGKYVDEKDAKVSIFDSALMFGDMVFEMTRSFNQKQFRLREHLERMYVGIKILRIPMKITIDELEKSVTKQ